MPMKIEKESTTKKPARRISGERDMKNKRSNQKEINETMQDANLSLDQYYKNTKFGA